MVKFVPLFVPPKTENRLADICKAVCLCSGRESNPYGHFCPQDFKSGVYTNFTTRAPFRKRPANFFWSVFRAQDKSRTCTPFLALPPQSSVSTIPPPGPFKSLPGLIQRGNTSNYENFERKTGLGDPNLGKVVLYQLSYFRIWDCKYSNLFCSAKIFSFF